jgi:hypothetical protein
MWGPVVVGDVHGERRDAPHVEEEEHLEDLVRGLLAHPGEREVPLGQELA